VGLLLALVVLARQVRGFERRRGATGRLVPRRDTMRRILGFALPRTLASGLEQSIIWFDVVLVGVIAGSAAAGVYGAASRFVAAGVIVLTALRIVVAPRFSSQLAAGRVQEVQTLYTVTAGWILLFGAPIYVLLAVFSPTVLGWLGPDIGAGVPAMRILCLGAIMLLAGGNIQSLLLMSGRSGWGAFNKAVVFTVNVIGNLLLVPPFGITGAACAWALCMSLDTGLAMLQVYRFTRIRPALGRILLVLGIVLVTVGVPAVLVMTVLGNTTVAFLSAAVLSGLLVLGYCWVDGRRLRIGELRALVPARGRGQDARVTTR
jgi:O-antigen/teichoic acid export membrane protein